MKKAFKILLLNLILLRAFSALFGCEILDIGKKPPHVCSFEDINVVSELSCTTDGIVVEKCMCGRQNTDITPALGHSFGEWVTVLETGCANPGLEERICSVCGTQQTKNTERTDHDYRVSEEIIDGTIYNRYTCLTCGESFVIDGGISLPVTSVSTKHLYDRSEDISFIVICTQDEEYLRSNLKIINYYYENSPTDGEPLDYKLTSLGNYRWIVSPVKKYTPGYTYLALRSGGVIFEEYGFSDLAFSIFREDSNDLILKEDIIYVAALEEKFGGYYPYNIDLSGGSGEYFLSLEKADGLSVGDVICVGDASSAEEVVTKGGLNVFGKVTSITTLGDGRSLIMLKELKPSELFLLLDLCESDVLQAESLKIPVGLEEKFKSALLSDPDYINMLGALYEAGLAHLAKRGLSTDIKNVQGLIDKITLNTNQSTLLINNDYSGRSAIKSRIELTANISMPAILGMREIGTLSADLTVYAEVDPMSMTVQLRTDDQSPDEIYCSLDVDKTAVAGLIFDVNSTITYEPDNDIFVRENKTSLYHFKGCELMKNAIWGSYTAESVYELMLADLSGEAAECPLCHPISFFKESLCVLDNKTKEYHSTQCEATELILKADMAFAECLDGEYLPCTLCKKNNIKSAFGEVFEKRVSDGNFELYQELIVDSQSDGYLSVGSFSGVVTGIDREVVAVSISFDFILSPSAHYSFELSRHQTFGYRSTKEGLKKHIVENKSEFSSSGITLADGNSLPIDLKTEFSVYIAGFKPEMIEIRENT